MKVFDLHCHPTLKPLFSTLKNRNSPWHTIKINVDDIFGNIYDSQSNPKQLLMGNCNIACVGLMPLEVAFAERCLAQLGAFVSKNIDIQQLSNIANKNKGCSYKDLLEQEINSVIQYKDGPDGYKIKFINSISDYNPDDNQTLHLIGSLEGGHTLYHDKNLYKKPELLIQKIRSFRNGTPLSLLYLTISHLSQNVLANHAHGMKIFSKKPFIPKGDGITDLGHKIINECLNDSVTRRPILIDIKHLSLKSRLDYYNTYGTSHPIIASHVAVTGCSYMNMPIKIVKRRKRWEFIKVKYDKQKGYLPNTYFNPNSINLYDEDIEIILKSYGLIGLILDERVLGYFNSPFVPDWIETEGSKEFISIEEENTFLNPGDYIIQEESVSFDDEDEVDESIENKLLDPIGLPRDITKSHLHIRYFVNNILHILKIGKKIGINAENHISIGSDFDGLINAIDQCSSAVQYPNLYDLVRESLHKYASNELSNVDEFVDKLFYNNGIEFLQKNFA